MLLHGLVVLYIAFRVMMGSWGLLWILIGRWDCAFRNVCSNFATSEEVMS